MFKIEEIDFKKLIGLQTKRSKIMYCLARLEVEIHDYPESWRGMLTCSHMETLIPFSNEKLEIFFEAVFGKEELEKL